MILLDLLRPGLNIVFCGTAAGNKSAERKAYYAGAGNLFYPTLAGCGLTPRLLRPNEYSELLNYNIGLTDLVKFHFGMDKDLKAEHYVYIMMNVVTPFRGKLYTPLAAMCGSECYYSQAKYN